MNKKPRKNASLREKKSDLHFWMLTSLYKKLCDEAKKEGRSVTDKLTQILIERYNQQ